MHPEKSIHQFGSLSGDALGLLFDGVTRRWILVVVGLRDDTNAQYHTNEIYAALIRALAFCFST